jgi:hypothetical protein
VSVTARDQTNVSLPRYRVKTKRGLVCGAQQLPISPCFLRPSIMSDRRPLTQGDYTPDPFADGHHAHFQEPMPRPYESTTSLPQDFGGPGQQYDDEEAIEKQPLTGGNVAGGFYPPGCVEHHLNSVLSILIFFSPGR